MLIYSMQLQQTQASNLIVLSLAQLSSGWYIVSMTGFPQKISLWSPLWHEFPQKNLLSHVPSLTWFPSRSYHCWWIWKLCYSLFYNRFAHTEGKKEDFVQKKLLETAQKVKNEHFLSNSRLSLQPRSWLCFTPVTARWTTTTLTKIYLKGIFYKSDLTH